MTLRKVRDLGWDPLYVIATVGASVSSGLAPAGLDKAVGLVTGAYMKDPSDPQWATDPGFQDWLAFMQRYMPGADLTDINNVYGYCAAQTGIQVFKQCGQDLSRENIMRQAASLDIHAADVPDRHPLPTPRRRTIWASSGCGSALRRPSLGAVRRSDRGVGGLQISQGQSRSEITTLPTMCPIAVLVLRQAPGCSLENVGGGRRLVRKTTRAGRPIERVPSSLP